MTTKWTLNTTELDGEDVDAENDGRQAAETAEAVDTTDEEEVEGAADRQSRLDGLAVALHDEPQISAMAATIGEAAPSIASIEAAAQRIRDIANVYGARRFSFVDKRRCSLALRLHELCAHPAARP